MMGYRWLINVVLFGIVILLGSLVLTTPTEDPLKLPPLTTLKAEDIHTIKISYPSNTVIELAKDDKAQWQLLAPLQLAANQYRIKHLLQVLSETYTKKLDVDSLNLQEFGLSPASVDISFDQTTLKFGETSPINQRRRYVQMEDSVYLILDTVSFLLSENVLEFVSLYPLGEAAKITDLQLPDYHLKQEGNNWQLTSSIPDNTNTSADALISLVQHWETAQAMDVLPYAEAEFQGDISITLTSGDTLHFSVISIEPTFTIARLDKGLQYEFAASYVDKLLHLPAKVDEESDVIIESDEEDSEQ